MHFEAGIRADEIKNYGKMYLISFFRGKLCMYLAFREITFLHYLEQSHWDVTPWEKESHVYIANLTTGKNRLFYFCL